MGYSAPYNVFTGGVELLAGLLLFSRRLTTIGALLSIAALTNVLMLSSYDVHVKLFTLHLLAMGVFLLAPDLRRLGNVFLFNRVAPPAELEPSF
jgi:hypothetical protein